MIIIAPCVNKICGNTRNIFTIYTIILLISSNFKYLLVTFFMILLLQDQLFFFLLEVNIVKSHKTILGICTLLKILLFIAIVSVQKTEIRIILLVLFICVTIARLRIKKKLNKSL
jgi:hypothetical protein